MKIIPNFLSKDEISTLSEWIKNNKNGPYFKDVFIMGGHRKTTRFSQNIIVEYPKVAYQIQKRIINKFNIKDFKYPPFPNGMAASYALVGDKVNEHIDGICYPGYETIHFNVILENSSGADIILHYTDKVRKFSVPVGDLMYYNVGRVLHEVETVIDIPRLMWVFGFCISESEWEEIEL